ncbi:phospho-2-dehydro-3-deoxyheptonate aldolase [uncultured Bacteroides sp.]|uniref:phospho-2-dehydro-3-deoxyheptonate aldolase n=1 Tax=uncultured Bacteroides sp. TaxID=162156 RepID=UPI002616B9C3|nr:phospho-2-dehydro-3-deoxyheptonate aldolase [uncultured Bacteroides sp.]
MMTFKNNIIDTSNGNYTNIIAGPCSAENRDQLFNTAEALKNIGICKIRAGLWKPRSRFGTFEGVGCIGLPWLKEIQSGLGMKVMTEVALPSHVEMALKYDIDMLWIGARTTVNPFMVTELAGALKGTKIPVYIKNPMCPDIELWAGCIERMMHADIKNLFLIHRGFCLLDNTPYRNSPLWELSDKIREEFPNIPIYCDPSHMAGNKELIHGICLKAIEKKYDGIFIESHISPKDALSDARQQITPAELKFLLENLENNNL